jgi:hypothetical protein
VLGAPDQASGGDTPPLEAAQLYSEGKVPLSENAELVNVKPGVTVPTASKGTLGGGLADGEAPAAAAGDALGDAAGEAAGLTAGDGEGLATTDGLAAGEGDGLAATAGLGAGAVVGAGAEVGGDGAGWLHPSRSIENRTGLSTRCMHNKHSHAELRPFAGLLHSAQWTSWTPRSAWFGRDPAWSPR